MKTFLIFLKEKGSPFSLYIQEEFFTKKKAPVVSVRGFSN
jgi:hypothetical protein